MDFVPGALVAGRYRLKRMVGSGGMGEVWGGEDTKGGGRVAVKHLLPAAAKHHEVVARFKREAYLLGRVESEYVARVIDFFDDETYGLVLVMEFIDGPSLAHVLEQRSLTVEEAIDLAVDLLRALSDLHKSKIVHRDLKPGNIIMRPVQGLSRATVVDFGISRLLPGKGENEVTGITRANIALGTVEYMAPEQILNSRDVTPVTDLYAVGIILFRSVKGHHAFGDRRGEELARAKLIEDAPILETSRRDEIATGLTAVVARALKKKPSQRYPSAVAMLAEVEELQQQAMRNVDLDEATTDSSDTTAVKLSPLASRPGDDMGGGQNNGSAKKPVGPFAPLPRPLPNSSMASSSMAHAPPGAGHGPPGGGPPPGVQTRPASLPPTAETKSPVSSGAPAPPRAPLRSIPEVAPVAQRGSMASIPDMGAPPSDMSASPSRSPQSPRGSLASLPDFGRPDSDNPVVVAPPPRSELTMERGGLSLSKGTVALAILTAFAVGAAVGLIVAPTHAPATKVAQSCAPCASGVVAAAPDPTPLLPPATTALAPPTPSGSALAAGSSSASATASVKPVLTGKLPSAAPSATAPRTARPPPSKPDGLGEDPPPRPTMTAPPPFSPTGTATPDTL